jgi:hypothetical protein
VLDLARRGEAETLLGALMSFLFRHNNTLYWGGPLKVYRFVIIRKFSYRKRGIGRKKAESADSFRSTTQFLLLFTRTLTK